MPDAAQVEVIVEDEGWGDPSGVIVRAATRALAHLGLEPAGYEISVLAADDARIRVLNAEFRGKDAPTNVLSWPAVDLRAETPGALPEPPEPGTLDAPEALGDIALARETCLAEAEEQGKRPDDHLTHLVVHSVLHLLGYDHETDDDAALMEATETAILAGMGIGDPYSGRSPSVPETPPEGRQTA